MKELKIYFRDDSSQLDRVTLKALKESAVAVATDKYLLVNNTAIGIEQLIAEHRAEGKLILINGNSTK